MKIDNAIYGSPYVIIINVYLLFLSFFHVILDLQEFEFDLPDIKNGT